MVSKPQQRFRAAAYRARDASRLSEQSGLLAEAARC